MNKRSLTVNEDGSGGGDVLISESGYTFGDVNFVVRPLTYTEYESMTGRGLSMLFPQRPAPASSEKNKCILLFDLCIKCSHRKLTQIIMHIALFVFMSSRVQ